MAARPTLEKFFVNESKEGTEFVEVKSFGCVLDHLLRGNKLSSDGEVTPEMSDEEKKTLEWEEGEERKSGWEEKETVEVELGEDGKGNFYLSLPQSQKLKTIPLCHSPICPMRGCDKRSIVPAATKIKKIKVGVCVLIEDCDHKVFLTQRGPLRIFPGMWVLPGGHWDPGEVSSTTALREVQEETGITLSPSSLQLLCMWESSFPISLSRGHPKAHHLVIFYRAILPSSSSTLSLALQETEVQASCWLGVEEVREAVKGKEVRLQGTRIGDGKGERKEEVVVGSWEIALGHVYA
eukprot:CAMPEP_0201523872 /NCGR_PEP_ID=MMETSP0161_2-20130828/20970_1 /ASSEMBLY_ACC=CAM_ASM_000251 /TAXON_ID=180227 /ORGANISM="Neoparamoeba aestuarina, Strain SoJaBio B1-5/56/2" /LENGTH=293 /DNA_ID=CAMNT_0047923103 /DNA_START=66 /DNA_END=944 /DNA_ORIENTATION=+